MSAARSIVECEEAKVQLAFLGAADDEVIELQALKVAERGDYKSTRAINVRVRDIAKAFAALPNAQGIFLVANPIRTQATQRRPHGSWEKLEKGEAVADDDILYRRVMMIDCDAIRPSGTSASDEQKAESSAVADRVFAFLIEAGIADESIARVDSGNGYQLWIALDNVPCDDGGTVKRILVALDAMFATPGVKIDTGVSDPKRLFPLAGTMKRKGLHSAEYPHRPVRVIDAPGLPLRVTLEELGALASKLADTAEPHDKPGPAKTSPESIYTRANAVSARDVMTWLGKMRGEHPVCTGCGECDGTSVVFCHDGVKCSHDRCSQRGLMGFRTPVDLVAEVRNVEPREAARLIIDRFLAEPSPAVTSADDWHVLSVEELFTPQTDAAFLVKDLGLAPGAPSFLIGQGFVGKTITAMSLGISVATGRPIWGQPWAPTRTGRVLHFDYEQGRRVTSKRLQRLAAGLGVSQAELSGRWGCGVLPRFDLTTADAIEIYSRLCEGYALVILDSLKGATPGVEENSSAIRDFVRVLTAASERTGATMLVIHHAGKSPLAGQGRPRKEMGRGSSAIFDEAQSVFVLTGEKGQPFLVTHEKDRERGSTVEDFTLSIVDTADGGLAVRGAGAPVRASSGAADLEKQKARVLALLRETEPGLSRRGLAKHLSKRPTELDPALEALLDEGLIEHNGAKGAFARYLAVPNRH